MEMILHPSLLMLKQRTILVQEEKVKGSSQDSKKEERGDASIAIGLATLVESVLTIRILQEMIAIITTTKEIERKTGSTTNERGMLPLLNMEMAVLLRSQETLGMKNLML